MLAPEIQERVLLGQARSMPQKALQLARLVAWVDQRTVFHFAIATGIAVWRVRCSPERCLIRKAQRVQDCSRVPSCMESDFFKQPILNSPYEYPARHWE